MNILQILCYLATKEPQLSLPHLGFAEQIGGTFQSPNTFSADILSFLGNLERVLSSDLLYLLFPLTFSMPGQPIPLSQSQRQCRKQRIGADILEALASVKAE